jgi:hypothetical protein
MITGPAVPPGLPATTASVPPLMPTKPLPFEVAPTTSAGVAPLKLFKVAEPAN